MTPQSALLALTHSLAYDTTPTQRHERGVCGTAAYPYSYPGVVYWAMNNGEGLHVFNDLGKGALHEEFCTWSLNKQLALGESQGVKCSRQSHSAAPPASPRARPRPPTPMPAAPAPGAWRWGGYVGMRAECRVPQQSRASPLSANH